MNDTGADWNGYAFLRRPSDFGGSGCYCGVCGADLNFLLVVGSCDGYVGNAAEAMLIRRYRGHIPFHRDRERLPGRNRVVAADLRESEFKRSVLDVRDHHIYRFSGYASA